ncbi:hypothetical protein Tsubulata_031727 [Turnera subulata]|uniref:CCHC-type domain-containing protein n=1 Tax=Turnera subulata TaxID=218843 RepID=A0A9Q0FET3_9ROSI|nr:hypothetical protein Tsubulata_031727 [Turnera subulata]
MLKWGSGHLGVSYGSGAIATASAAYGGASRPPDTSTGAPNGGGMRSSFKDKLLQWRSHIACPWVFSIITKVLGRKFSYRFICSKVASLWKPQGGFQVIDLANDYFLVRFERREDCARVLVEGPWTIQGSYMTVQSWQPGFDASKDPTRTVVWVQIPELPVEWYRQDILNAVARQIGKPIRIDINTLHAERAKFARLAIEVEFTTPLLGRVEIEGRWFKVSYEDIPDFCFLCGFVGHMASQCPKVRSQPPVAEQDRPVQPPVVPISASHRPQDAGLGQEGCSKFGAWMKVSKPPRIPRMRGAAKAGGPVVATNPFDLESATALLEEVMRDPPAGPSSETVPPVVPVVFQAPSVTRALDTRKKPAGPKSKGKSS